MSLLFCVDPLSAKIIMEKMGHVLEMEDQLVDGNTKRNFVRARVLLNIKNPREVLPP